MKMKYFFAVLYLVLASSCTLTSTSSSEQGPKQAVGTVTGMVIGGKIARDLTKDSSNKIIDKKGVVDFIMELHEKYHCTSSCVEDVAMNRSIFQALNDERRRTNNKERRKTKKEKERREEEEERRRKKKEE